MALSFGPIVEQELDELDAVLGPALHFPGGTMRDFIVDMVGLEHMHAVKRDGRIVAGLGAFPMGQWYGGRPVGCAGITAVGVAPDVRGGGVGAFMLRQSLQELRDTGTPLAALYPATLSFYRGAGYERAAYRIMHELPLGLIDQRPSDRELELVPFGPERYPEAHRLYELRAARSTGNLVRPEWLWKVRMEPKDKQPFRFFAMRGDQIEGSIVYTVGGRSDPILISDLIILTAAAGRRFLSLLAAYQSVLEVAVWSGSVTDPLVYALGENLTAGSKSRVGIRNTCDWMLRIVHAQAALEARGYPAGLGAEVAFELADTVLPDNAGTYTLTVEGGRASVRRGGAAQVQMDARGLAALYTGFMAPQELCVLGRLDGPDEELALLGAVFSGPRPWIVDMF